jgi:uncharacterized membrane protein
VACAFSAAAFYGSISIYRHDRFASDAYDLGIFDQTVWGYSRFQIVRNTVKGVPNLLGDHFHPALMAVAPAYWIWSDARVLLVVQALLLAAASLPVFWWARPRVGLTGASAVQLGFLVFWGLLAGVIFDFHELALAVLAISFGLYALLERRHWLFWSMFAFGCLCKEDIALTFTAMGVYALLVQRRPRFSVAVCSVGLGWFALTVSTIIPAISGHRYHYWDYPGLGSRWTQAPLALARRPWRTTTLLFDRAVKRNTLAALFGAWLFLPLASPLLLVALPTLAERFWAGNPSFWTTKFQYSLPLAPVLAFAAVDTAGRLGERRRLAAFALLASSLLVTVAIVRPLAGLGRYMSASRAAATDACLDHIPASASVAASGGLIPHLTHRLHVYRLGHGRGAFVAIEHDGSARDRRRPSAARTDEDDYRLVCRGGDVTVLASQGPQASS